MVCSYCKKKMSDGYIPAIQSALMWIPDNEKVPLFIFSKAKGGVNLTKVPFFKRQKAKYVKRVVGKVVRKFGGRKCLL